MRGNPFLLCNTISSGTIVRKRMLRGFLLSSQFIGPDKVRVLVFGNPGRTAAAHQNLRAREAVNHVHVHQKAAVDTEKPCAERTLQIADALIIFHLSAGEMQHDLSAKGLRVQHLPYGNHLRFPPLFDRKHPALSGGRAPDGFHTRRFRFHLILPCYPTVILIKQRHRRALPCAMMPSLAVTYIGTPPPKINRAGMSIHDIPYYNMIKRSVRK